MIRSFIFSQGKLISQDVGMDFLKMVLFDEDVHIWVDADKPTTEETKALLEGVFAFHPLAIEDCVAVSERPKVDEYENYIFMVVHAMSYQPERRHFQGLELNLFIGRNFLVTYHHDSLPSITSTIERVQKNTANVARAPDRLTYHLLDTLLENYAPSLTNFSMEIGELDQHLLADRQADVLADVIALKMEVQRLRQTIAPMREVLARIIRGEFKVVHTRMLPYYRDLQDQLSHIYDQAENYREALTDVLQVQFNLQQARTNQVIKVLTVMATLGMPILVITSYYGMNVRHFPNTEWPAWPFAYLWVLSLTLLITAILLWYMRRKGWY